MCPSRFRTYHTVDTLASFGHRPQKGQQCRRITDDNKTHPFCATQPTIISDMSKPIVQGPESTFRPHQFTGWHPVCVQEESDRPGARTQDPGPTPTHTPRSFVCVIVCQLHWLRCSNNRTHPASFGRFYIYSILSKRSLWLKTKKKCIYIREKERVAIKITNRSKLQRKRQIHVGLRAN